MFACKESTPFCLQALVEITVVSIARVPEVVIVPPVIPVPLFVATLVTVPPASELLIAAAVSAKTVFVT